MWAAHDGVNGVAIDSDERVLMWFDDAVACACADSFAEQSFAEFKAMGPVLTNIPADVLTELRESVQTLS
jgi:hypothetical protein